MTPKHWPDACSETTCPGGPSSDRGGRRREPAVRRGVRRPACRRTGRSGPCGSGHGARGTAVGAVPPTIQALLAARLDRLPRRSGRRRTRIDRRADFEAGAVVALSPEDEGATSAIAWEACPQGGSPTRATGIHGHEPTGSAICSSATPHTRRCRSSTEPSTQRFADWLMEAAADRLVEYEEIVGYHLEQAYGYAADLDIVDDHSRELADVRVHLSSSARRARAREDAGAASDLFVRLWSSPGRLLASVTGLALELADALVTMGEWMSSGASSTSCRGGARRPAHRRSRPVPALGVASIPTRRCGSIRSTPTLPS